MAKKGFSFFGRHVYVSLCVNSKGNFGCFIQSNIENLHFGIKLEELGEITRSITLPLAGMLLSSTEVWLTDFYLFSCKGQLTIFSTNLLQYFIILNMRNLNLLNPI